MTPVRLAEQISGVSEEQDKDECHEDGKRSQVKDLIQLVEGLQQQLQARDSWCQQLEKRSSEEQQNHKRELSAFGRQIAQLEEQLKQQGRREMTLSAPSADDPEKQRLLQQLEKSSQQLHQLQLLLAEQAAAKTRSDQEQRRMQNELEANRERTKDLERQLLLVDEQLVGILKHAASPASNPPREKQDTKSAQLVPLAPLGVWAVQQLQGMRDTLKGVQEKKPLGPSAEARRQPPLEAAPLAPLQHLSRDPSAHAETMNSYDMDWKEQQGLILGRGPQGATNLQQRQPAFASEDTSTDAASMHPQNPTVKKRPPLQQLAEVPSSQRRGDSPLRYVCTPQRPVAGQRADVYPVACGTRLSDSPGELQHQQRVQVPQVTTMLFGPLRQVREQLDRQRTHRQQLLQRSAHQPQHMVVNQALHAPVSSHLQTSFTSMLGYPQVAVQNYAACPLPLHRRQAVNQQHAHMDPNIRAASPQCSSRVTPSRLRARYVGPSVT